MNKPQQPSVTNLNIKPEDLQSVCCSCGNEHFYQAFEVKKLSAIMSSDGKEKFAPLPVLLCTKCQTPLGKVKE